jgi:hypothetical protein
MGTVQYRHLALPSGTIDTHLARCPIAMETTAVEEQCGGGTGDCPSTRHSISSKEHTSCYIILLEGAVRDNGSTAVRKCHRPTPRTPFPTIRLLPYESTNASTALRLRRVPCHIYLTIEVGHTTASSTHHGYVAREGAALYVHPLRPMHPHSTPRALPYVHRPTHQHLYALTHGLFL